MSRMATGGRDQAGVTAGAYYEIRLKGHLDACWAERFGVVSLSNVEGGETVLVGLFADQAALFGVLLQIHSLGVTLLSVNHRTAPTI